MSASQPNHHYKALLHIARDAVEEARRRAGSYHLLHPEIHAAEIDTYERSYIVAARRLEDEGVRDEDLIAKVADEAARAES